VRDLRMLCLHGYHGTGATLRRQMAPLAAAIPSNVELVYVDAPSLSLGDFGWWHDGFRGWERTRDWAAELLRTAPRIDGIFGFSQGAALAGLLAALRDSRPSPLWFEFAIMVGGFTSTMPQHAELFRHKLTVPSVHVTGRADVIVPRRDSLLLADRFAGPLVIEHPGGHVIPAGTAVTAPIADLLARFAHSGSAAPALDGTGSGQ
jgi:predicted esterase